MEPVIDTGFDGYLTLPAALAKDLGLILWNFVEMKLADGSVHVEFLFDAEVEFLGQIKPIQVFVLQSDECLIGTELLDDCQLVIDFPTQTVNLFRSTSKTKK